MEYGKSAITKVLTAESIKDRIYTIRGVQVMLDSDLAKLYDVETKRINEAVKRNPRRFPSRCFFVLSEKETEMLFSRSQPATLKGSGHNIKYNPHVFTEQGVAMLATVLTSEIAVNVSLNIMDAFVEMRHYLADNVLVFNRLDLMFF